MEQHRRPWLAAPRYSLRSHCYVRRIVCMLSCISAPCQGLSGFGSDHAMSSPAYWGLISFTNKPTSFPQGGGQTVHHSTLIILYFSSQIKEPFAFSVHLPQPCKRKIFCDLDTAAIKLTRRYSNHIQFSGRQHTNHSIRR